MDDRNLVLTNKYNGKVTDTEKMELSPDLKTLTITTRATGSDKPSVMVFDRK